jgi:hypothetical protein
MALLNTIQIRRGTDAERLASFVPSVGELIYATDTKKVFVGDGSTVGGVSIGQWSNIGATDDIYYQDGSVVIGTNVVSGDAASLEVTGNLRTEGQAWSVQQTEVSDSGDEATIDFDEGNSWILDLSGAGGDVTVTAFSNGRAGASYLLKVEQGATPVDVTWPGSVVWLGNEPTLTDEANGFNVLTFYYDGTNFLGTGDANIDKSNTYKVFVCHF